MAVIKGYDGHVDWGTIMDSDVAYRAHSWTLDVEGDTEDITDFDSTGWREFVGTLKGWSGSVELYRDDTNTVDPTDVNSQATLKLYLNATHYFSGPAIVTGIHPAHTIDGVATQSIDFQGTSDLNYD